MANELIQAGPYPVPADSPDGPNQMKAIVDWIAGRSVMRFATVAARDTALPSGTVADGQLCFVAADNAFYVRVAGAWQVLWRADISPMVQRGSVTVNAASLAAGSVGTVQAFSFPRPFPGAPAITVSRWGANTPVEGAIWGASTTGFSITPRNSGSIATPAGFSMNFFWIAVY